MHYGKDYKPSYRSPHKYSAAELADAQRADLEQDVRSAERHAEAAAARGDHKLAADLRAYAEECRAKLS